MKRNDPIDKLLHPGGAGQESGDDSVPFESEAMVYVGDIYSIVAGAANGGNPKSAAPHPDPTDDSESLWPFIR